MFYFNDEYFTYCVFFGLSFRTIEIFASTVSFVGYGYSIQQFIPVKKSDLTMDDEKISFTTTVSGPSLYVVGLPISTVGVTPTPLTVVPLQCVVSVSCPSVLDSYLYGTFITVRISMDLRSKEVIKPSVTCTSILHEIMLATCTCTCSMYEFLSSATLTLRANDIPEFTKFRYTSLLQQ